MSSITKVALAGATGNLGPAILNAILAANFTVTVLTRANNTHTFPPAVTVKPVDYDSLDSLTGALSGQDAFISTLSIAAIKTQLLLVDAAAKAHIKRFIPSEFGSNTLNEKTRTLPFHKDKVVVQEALQKEAASENGMTYTAICTGPFLDWGIRASFIVDLKGKSVTLYDGGERLFSATTLATVGKAVVGVLTFPDQTRNRTVYVQDTATTLKKLAAMGKKATGGAEGWKENVVSMDEVVEQAWAERKRDGMALNFIKPSVWGEGYGGHFEKVDNELLGIKEMSDAELQALVDSLAK